MIVNAQLISDNVSSLPIQTLNHYDWVVLILLGYYDCLIITAFEI